MRSSSRTRLSGWLVVSALFLAGLTIVLLGSPREAIAAGASGWIIGSSPANHFGVILHTSNDGQTWVRQGSAEQIPNVGLANVKAVDRDNAWVVGDAERGYGLILKTSDAGQTWVRQGDRAMIPDVTISGVGPVDQNTAWVVGDNGTILHTADGGQHWTRQSSETTADLWEVAAADAQNAWITGNSDDGYAVILHTSNGGQTWERQGSAATLHASGFIDLSVVDAKTAWAVGQANSVVKTTDGGATWQTQMGDSNAFTDNNGVCAVDGNTAWVATDYNTVYGTTNGGTLWNQQGLVTGGGFYLLGVSALGSDAAWVVGGAMFPPIAGVIMHTPDAGATWQIQPAPVSVTFRRVAMVKPSVPSKPAAPSKPYSVTYGPVQGGSRIQWAGSPDATGYSVYSAGRLLGTTGPAASSLFVRGLLGPNAKITVVALGSYNTASEAASGVYALKARVKVGTVRFKGNSARLTPATKRSLRAYAALLSAQGFTRLYVDGYTAKHDHGSRAFRRRLSLARAKKVRTYLTSEFRRLDHRITINASGHSGANPVGSNSTATGAAMNRRAELVLR